MAKEQLIKVIGKVTEILPNTTFKVKLDDNGAVIQTYLGGKLRKFDINIELGDLVEVEMSPYDLTKGRIIFRR